MMRAVILTLLLTGLILTAGCGGQSSDSVVGTEAGKLTVIGIDSADWRLLQPMVDEGRLPHLQAFMAEASYGRMKTFYPLEKSPLLWASICTGVMPEVHGVTNFVKGSDQEPVSGSAWYAPALWDILGAAGLSTSIVGMWTTYPARPIDGVMVSDYLPYGHARAQALKNLVYPDSLAGAVTALRVTEADISDDILARFINREHLALANEKYPKEMDTLRGILAADMGYIAVNEMLAREFDFDLFFFYQRGPDMISHHFYPYMKPDSFKGVMTPEAREIFGEVVHRYYEWSDEVLGQVLSWFPADRQTAILSDHGFYGPRKSGVKGSAEHSEWGIFLARSPLFEPGYKFDQIELLDICPTFLALMGLPAGRDMPGVVLTDGLTASGRARVDRMEKNRVESYLPLRPAQGPAGERDEAVNEEIRKQLRSLGYIN